MDHRIWPYLPSYFYVISLFRLCKNDLLLSFSGQTTYSRKSNRLTMAGVLEQIMGSKRRLVRHSGKAPWVNPKVLELQTAKEILAEVFGVRISDVEEMLQLRCEVEVQSCSREEGLWQESFCLAE